MKKHWIRGPDNLFYIWRWRWGNENFVIYFAPYTQRAKCITKMHNHGWGQPKAFFQTTKTVVRTSEKPPWALLLITSAARQAALAEEVRSRPRWHGAAMCSSPAALRDMWSGADDGKPAQHGSHESMIGYLACGKKWDLRIFFREEWISSSGLWEEANDSDM
jgi:hypothetical protein